LLEWWPQQWVRCWLLQFQAFSLGLGEQWERVKSAYAAANRALGDIVKARRGLL
jgi:pyruvate carboxylase